MMRIAILSALLVLGLDRARADGHVYAPYPALYVQECASCHVAFPPELMSAQGWRNLIAQLDRHFGIDASLDTRTRDAIAGFLAARASTRDKHAATEPTARITKTSWFVREHRKAGPATTSFADCGACHANADQADYSERGRGHGRRH